MSREETVVFELWIYVLNLKPFASILSYNFMRGSGSWIRIRINNTAFSKRQVFQWSFYRCNAKRENGKIVPPPVEILERKGAESWNASKYKNIYLRQNDGQKKL